MSAACRNTGCFFYARLLPGKLYIFTVLLAGCGFRSGAVALSASSPGSRVAEAGQLVVIDHPHRLKEGTHDGGAHKTHAPALQITGDPVGQLGAGAKHVVHVHDHLATVNPHR